MYKSILVPLDGSTPAEAILPHVEELAKQYGAKIILLNVVEPEPAIIAREPFYTTLDPEMYQQRIKEMKAYLQKQAKKFRGHALITHIQISEGPTVEEIIHTAKREKVDLIAMASHGRTGLSHVFYGSVAAGVLHRIDRPLLLIRALDKKHS